MASRSSAVGSSTSAGSSFAGASAGSFAASPDASSSTITTPTSAPLIGGLGTQVQIVVVVIVVVVVRDGHGGLGPRRAQAGELGLFELGLATARPGQDGLDELLV